MLRVNYEGVEGCVAAIGKAIEDIQNTAGEINKVVMQELGEHWEGDSYDACIQTYEENYQELLTTKVPEMVEELKKFMEDCKKHLADTDAQLAGK